MQVALKASLDSSTRPVNQNIACIDCFEAQKMLMQLICFLHNYFTEANFHLRQVLSINCHHWHRE